MILAVHYVLLPCDCTARVRVWVRVRVIGSASLVLDHLLADYLRNSGVLITAADSSIVFSGAGAVGNS